MKKKTYSTQQVHGTVQIPNGAVLMSHEEKEHQNGGARRPNSLAWNAGQALVGMQFFGLPGLGFFFL